MYFCSNLDAISKIIKMNFGRKFGAWVFFHTTPCSPENFKKIWGAQL